METNLRTIKTETLERWLGHLAGRAGDPLAERLKQDIEQELQWNRNQCRKVASSHAHPAAQSGK